MGSLDAMTRLRWGLNHWLTCTGGSTNLTSLGEERSGWAAFLHSSGHQHQWKLIRALEKGMGGVTSSFEPLGVSRIGIFVSNMFNEQ